MWVGRWVRGERGRVERGVGAGGGVQALLANCFNPYYRDGMVLLLSRPLQPLINILDIWQRFLYHCLLMGGIITHSIIRQSAKDQP